MLWDSLELLFSLRKRTTLWSPACGPSSCSPLNMDASNEPLTWHGSFCGYVLTTNVEVYIIYDRPTLGP